MTTVEMFAEAHDDVTVGGLGDRVAVGPLGPPILKGEGIGGGIEMLQLRHSQTASPWVVISTR